MLTKDQKQPPQRGSKNKTKNKSPQKKMTVAAKNKLEQIKSITQRISKLEGENKKYKDGMSDAEDRDAFLKRSRTFEQYGEKMKLKEKILKKTHYKKDKTKTDPLDVLKDGIE